MSVLEKIDLQSEIYFLREKAKHSANTLSWDEICAVEDSFKHLINVAFEADSENFNDGMFRTLDNMGGEMRTWFDQFCERENITLPEGSFGTRGWLCATEVGK
jgi:hypothetical protein